MLFNCWTFTPQESGSDFASVVYVPTTLPSWRKLTIREYPALWHATFWGETVAIEEEEQPFGDDDQGGTDAMNVDVPEHIDKGWDFIPGCHLLDINIHPAVNMKMWIRAG